MAAIAKLSTVSTLDNTSFTHGLRGMQVSLSAFSSFSLGAFARVGSAFTGFIGQAIRSLPRFAAAGFHLGDALDDTSTRLGIAGGALSSFHRVAKFAGVEAEAFDAALGRMNVNLEDAATKGGDFQKALAAIGLDAKRLVALGPEKAFLAISDAVKGMIDPFKRAKLAREAFGREGGRLIPALIGGSAGFAEERRKAAALGLTPTRTQLAGIGGAKDAFADLGNAVKGFGLQLAVNLTAPMRGFSDALTGVGGKIGLIGLAADTLTTTFGDLAIRTELFTRWFRTNFPFTMSVLRGGIGGPGPIPSMDAPTLWETAVMRGLNAPSIGRGGVPVRQVGNITRPYWDMSRAERVEVDRLRLKHLKEQEEDRKKASNERQRKRAWEMVNPLSRNPRTGAIEYNSSIPIEKRTNAQMDKWLAELEKQTTILDRIEKKGGGMR